MDIVFLLTFFVFSPSCLVLSFVFIINGYEVAAILCLIFSVLLAFVSFFGLKIVIKVVHRRMNKIHWKLSEHISNNYSTSPNILFFFKNNYWQCNYDGGECVAFDLRGIFLKKTFLKAFVTRAIRYPLISNIQSVGLIWNYKFIGFDASIITSVIFLKKKNVRKTILLKDGISKYSLLSWVIMQPSEPPKRRVKYYSGVYFYHNVMTINEKIFQGKFM